LSDHLHGIVMTQLTVKNKVLACCVLAEQRRTSSRQDRLLLGEQVAKDIFHSLPELETLVRI